jgi:tetratricopeptide (TPR) repeat protein
MVLMYIEDKDPTDEEVESEQEKPRLSLVQFFKQFFGNYKEFLETHLKVEGPPFLVLMIWILGMASIIDRMELRYAISSTYQLNNWVSAWLLILITGIISGCLGYWVSGTWYHLRVIMCGGLREFRTSRYLFLYTGLPMYIVIILMQIFNTAVYGNRYFTEPTSWDFDMMWGGLSYAAVAFSIYLSYRGVRLLQQTKKIRTIIFFILLPSLFYVLVIGGIGYKTFTQYSKGIDYNEQAIEAIELGQFERAEELLKQALKYMNKDDREDIQTIYENLALVYEYQEETEEAIECFDTLLAFCDSNSADYHAIMGRIKILDEEVYAAITHFDMSLKLDPDNLDAHNHLGLIYLGMVDEEVENLERALIHNERAYALEAGTATLENLALNYFFLDRFSEAQPLFESLDEMIPDYGVAKYFLGLIHYAYGDLPKAVELLEQAIMCNPMLFNEEVERIIREARGQSGKT